MQLLCFAPTNGRASWLEPNPQLPRSFWFGVMFNSSKAHVQGDSGLSVCVHLYSSLSEISSRPPPPPLQPRPTPPGRVSGFGSFFWSSAYGTSVSYLFTFYQKERWPSFLQDFVDVDLLLVSSLPCLLLWGHLRPACPPSPQRLARGRGHRRRPLSASGADLRSCPPSGCDCLFPSAYAPAPFLLESVFLIHVCVLFLFPSYKSQLYAVSSLSVTSVSSDCNQLPKMLLSLIELLFPKALYFFLLFSLVVS